MGMNQRNGFSELLKRVVESEATDLHLKVPSPPVLRINGLLVPQEDWPALTPEYMDHIFEEVATPEQRADFAREWELDFAYSVHGLARFRVNALRQRGTMSLAFRAVPLDTPSIDALELPQICKELVLKPRGLILVTGPAGSGKSTTLAAMINHLNEHECRNVITIEDPIEHLFSDKKCLIRQRDLGDDTRSFSTALTHALRHDPDVIVVGEMRDLDTIGTAITAAETGHLVLATLHTIDAPQSIHRIVDVFPPSQQRQIRLQLSEVIEAIISQAMLPRIGGGRIAAFEIMLANSVIRRLVRDDKIHEISPNMEMAIIEGMQTMDQALARLVCSGIVAKEEAIKKSSDQAKLNELLQNQGESSCPPTSAEVVASSQHGAFNRAFASIASIMP
jgi:twitching motility protein PilT